MQYTIKINQLRALQWGLNFQQAGLFAFLYECPSWCQQIDIDGNVYTFVARTMVCEQMPLLTDKPDTVYRLLRVLRDKGLVDHIKQGKRDLVAITELGRTWNRDEDRKNFRELEINPGTIGKISGNAPENFPTEQGKTQEQPTTGAGCRRGTRLPSDWTPPAEFWNEAGRIRPEWAPDQVTTYLQDFADYWTARSDAGAVKRDWLATWRRWLRNQKTPPASAGSQRTRDRSALDIATDMSWAEDL